MDCDDIAAGGMHFVLVHGAMHGAWCWYKIVELLEKDGHKVSAIDLMSAGTNPVTADSITSFEEYNQPLMHFLAKLPQTEKPNIQHRQTRLPSSSAPLHGLRTTNQTFVHPVTPSCRLPNSGVPQSRHTRAPPTETHLRSQPNNSTHLRAHLHNGRALTRATKTPSPSRRTTNTSARSPRARLAQRVHLFTKSDSTMCVLPREHMSYALISP
eukprot:PITA_20141